MFRELLVDEVELSEMEVGNAMVSEAFNGEWIDAITGIVELIQMEKIKACHGEWVIQPCDANINPGPSHYVFRRKCNDDTEKIVHYKARLVHQR